MSKLKAIKQNIKEKKKEFSEAGETISNFNFFFIIIGAAYNILVAKWYLRKCTSVGHFVSTNKKPIIKNNGIINLSDHVRIWSNTNQTILFTAKNAILEVGENSRINGSHISVSNKLVIGKNVRIAPYCIIIDSDFHKVDDHFSNEGVSKPIIIEDDAWITMHCMIMKGVTIGKGAVVASGAVVTKDVPPYTVVAGVPAKIIKKIK